MKKAIVSLILTMGLMFSLQVKAADPLSSLVFGTISTGFGALSVSDKGQACDDEPLRKVAWKNNPNGYSFVVAGCDYQAKKDQLVLK